MTSCVIKNDVCVNIFRIYWLVDVHPIHVTTCEPTDPLYHVRALARQTHIYRKFENWQVALVFYD
jgi:hypothetical protein